MQDHPADDALICASTLSSTEGCAASTGRMGSCLATAPAPFRTGTEDQNWSLGCGLPHSLIYPCQNLVWIRAFRLAMLGEYHAPAWGYRSVTPWPDRSICRFCTSTGAAAGQRGAGLRRFRSACLRPRWMAPIFGHHRVRACGRGKVLFCTLLDACRRVRACDPGAFLQEWKKVACRRVRACDPRLNRGLARRRVADLAVRPNSRCTSTASTAG